MPAADGVTAWHNIERRALDLRAAGAEGTAGQLQAPLDFVSAAQSPASACTARSSRCAAWGCPQPATACDLDHTIAWEDRWITCECGLAPLCKS